MEMRSFKSTLFISLLAVVVSLTFTHTSYAQEGACKFDQSVFEGVSLANPKLDIKKTVGNILPSFLMNSISNISGLTMDEMAGCEEYFANNITGFVPVNDPPCAGTPEQQCQNFINQHVEPRTVGMLGPNRDRVSGSLLGINYIVEDALDEPLPLNLAYFMQDQFAPVPFVGPALAANTTYSGPFLDLVLGIWKVMRNVALSLMALVMVYVGFALMTRKQISQQTVVTVQYAIPKITIAIILIIFSYPIGATIASFGWVVRINASSIVETLFNVSGALGGGIWSSFINNALQSVSVLGLAGLITTLIGSMAALPVLTPILVLFGVIVFCIVTLHLFLQLKIFWTYLKLVTATVSSPFVFLWGAVPGNDATVGTWFKQMAVYVLSIFAMAGVPTIFNALATVAATQAGAVNTAISNNLLGSIAMPLVVIYGYYYAIKMPTIIENAIIGEAKPGGRR